MDIQEQEDQESEREALGIPTFWEWELKILNQEKDWLESKIEELDLLVDPDARQQADINMKIAQLQKQV